MLFYAPRIPLIVLLIYPPKPDCMNALFGQKRKQDYRNRRITAIAFQIFKIKYTFKPLRLNWKMPFLCAMIPINSSTNIPT
ncbi:hypothetical protein D7004_01340 [Pedobacter jejuensis]|uniref:Uncharacterized protein n=1 Tax=Pedobacter jejuensis TaxID=1268550 RepID=A0A3N0C2D4_9SPHI|nr:hypothetical protein D7004_01340 [Pedobacter jejuensis]